MRKLSLLLPFLLAAAVLAPSAPARAADNGNWAVYPSAGGADRRPYFYLAAEPGTTLSDQVTVTNKTAAPMTFRLYGADAYNTERDGGFAVRTRGEPQHGVGAWTRTGRPTVTVPARSFVTVPFTITVPADAEPGDHPGALVALDERVAAGRGPVAMGVQQAVGARVYLRIGGPAVPALAVEDVSLSQHRPLVPGAGTSRSVISYTLHNRGNVTLDPKVELTAKGLFGRTLLRRSLTQVPAELLPGQKVRLTEPWSGSPQLDWGDVSLTASAKDVTGRAGTSFLALPWLALGVLVAALAAGLTGWRLRRRRARRG
ncbi:WxL protein peptidoglycan domain-containing protein [Streptomyces sp. NPDC059070]|uniref:WxL protein peptidoglycan domain-containing protein n=1 Tax=unclassified Streptomyces TaxID=2593676 RepID=UPI0034E20E7D